MLGRRLCAVFGLCLVTFGCRDGEANEPDARAEEAPQPAQHEPGPPPKAFEPPPPAVDEPDDYDDRVADLDDLCTAVDHDYKDGTLGDYYADVTMRTDWGKAQMAAGNESITPGRLLEKAAFELNPQGDEPGLAACRRLLDYLDDVE